MRTVRVVLGLSGVLLLSCAVAFAGEIVPPGGGGGGAPAVPELDAGLLALIGTSVSAGIVGLRQKFRQKK